ncbi:acyl-coenzyme A thioesterase THEM4-like isoform X1 [Parambassis ranga]|uniref:Acyl-coenzyme A thioesterase THEM4 n=1 Tax=Parambassis ranga TaxID=210632 RepID=A0A6P7JU08_9TELE|nr:acyl-coenzyme A thioesterase THEM4-like isoform X1 [Parambassis ranga]
MARTLCRIFKGCQSICSLPLMKTRLHPSASVLLRTVCVRRMLTLPFRFSPKAQDFSLPNSSWGAEMRQLYEHYNSQCEEEMKGEEKQDWAWKRVPSYNRTLKHATGGVYLSKIYQSKARFFTRNIKEPGAAFEYVLFVSKDEQKCVCIFQAGHLLEGPQGSLILKNHATAFFRRVQEEKYWIRYVHGGAIATMIDTVTVTHASVLTLLIMTANLNINYRRPIPLGSTVLIDSSLNKTEGRKVLISCKVTSTDGSKLHTEATALFVVSRLLGG